MRRREFLAGVGAGAFAIGGVGVAWAYTGEEQSPETPSQTPEGDLPTAAKAAKPLAADFHARLSEFYPTTRVFVTPEGELAVEFTPTAENGEALRDEFTQVAGEFLTVLENGEYEATTLTMVASEVQALLVESALAAYLAGNITKEALLKTIEVRGVERRTAE